jgi:hypothetical protein
LDTSDLIQERKSDCNIVSFISHFAPSFNIVSDDAWCVFAAAPPFHVLHGRINHALARGMAAWKPPSEPGRPGICADMHDISSHAKGGGQLSSVVLTKGPCPATPPDAPRLHTLDQPSSHLI